MSVMQARRALRATGSAFDPRPVPGLTRWLEARFTRGVAIGAGVATAVDQSGLGGNATQATGGSQPLLIAGQANGQPIWRFDAVDDLLAGPLSGITRDTGVTVYVVAKFNAAGGTRALFDASDGVGTNRGPQIFMSTTTIIGRWVSGGAVFSFNDTTKFHIFTLNHQGTTRTISLDGVVQNTEVLTPANTTPTTYTIGALTNAAGPATADIAAMLLWGRSHGASEEKYVSRGLGGLYGVPVS